MEWGEQKFDIHDWSGGSRAYVDVLILVESMKTDIVHWTMKALRVIADVLYKCIHSIL